MPELEKGERMVGEVRKHPFVIITTAATLLLAVIVPFIFLIIAGAVSSLSPQAISGMTPLALFLYSIWLLGIWVFFFLDWTDYYLDVWHITDRRIIDVEQKGLFHREVISFRYDNIQDVTVETNGFLQTMLDFGDIHIQTAGADREIVLRNAARPEDAKRTVLDLHHKAKDAPQKVIITGREEAAP